MFFTIKFKYYMQITAKITATDSAFNRIEQLAKLDSNSRAILRVIVNSGGCSGLMYEYELGSDYTDEDYVIEQNNVKIVIDSLSQKYMDGSIIDFIEELGNSYFSIRNPKASSKCGCGNSFNL